jgi:acid phosphatase type 7
MVSLSFILRMYVFWKKGSDMNLQSHIYPLTVVILLAGWLLVIPGNAIVMSGVSDRDSGKDTTFVSYVTSTSSNSTVIRWYPPNVNPDNLLYANESYYIRTGSYDRTVPVNKTSPSPMILLSDLEAGIRYHYALQSDGHMTGNQSFLTFPQNRSCAFIVYGDTREQAPYLTQTERHKIVADRISREPGISFVINTGDLVSNPDDPEEWGRFFTAGKMLFATTTYAVVRGNHDSNLSLQKDLFGTDGMYSFDCGDAHIAVIDSTNYAAFSLPEQARWLAHDLASAEKWNIVILHHPLYTSEENHFGGFQNLQKELEPVFLSGNVRVVFNGHVHAYERIEQSGIQYITEGRGGAPAYRLHETKMDGSVRNRENSLGYSRLTINPAAESLQIDVIQVADVTPDLRNITQIYPRETVIDRIEFKKPGQQTNHKIISSKTFPLLFSCKNSSVPSGPDLSGQIPFCIVRGLLV